MSTSEPTDPTTAPFTETPGATPDGGAGDVLRTGAPIVLFWRPGCGFCSSLERGLQRTGVAYERVNIWDEPAAAAFVRSVANGNEVVPTVRVGAVALVNPSPAQVLLTAQSEVPAAVAGLDG